MKIKSSFSINIKPIEWLYCIAFLIIVSLVINGECREAAVRFGSWLRIMFN